MTAVISACILENIKIGECAAILILKMEEDMQHFCICFIMQSVLLSILLLLLNNNLIIIMLYYFEKGKNTIEMHKDDL